MLKAGGELYWFAGDGCILAHRAKNEKMNQHDQTCI